MSEYADLTREELEQRLAAAEDVCVLYGWTGSRAETDRDKALYMLWVAWSHIPGVGDKTTKDSGRLNDEVVRRLARRRDDVRSSTLARLFGPQS